MVLLTGGGILRNILCHVHLLHFAVEINDDGGDQSHHDDAVYAEDDSDDSSDGACDRQVALWRAPGMNQPLLPKCF